MATKKGPIPKSEIRYKCFFCGRVYTLEDLETTKGFCPNCGMNVFVKIRPNRPKIVQAR